MNHKIKSNPLAIVCYDQLANSSVLQSELISETDPVKRVEMFCKNAAFIFTVAAFEAIYKSPEPEIVAFVLDKLATKIPAGTDICVMNVSLTYERWFFVLKGLTPYCAIRKVDSELHYYRYAHSKHVWVPIE